MEKREEMRSSESGKALYCCMVTPSMNNKTACIFCLTSLCRLKTKKNDISFEDQERSPEKIKFLFFKTLYLWIVAYVSPLMISHSDFLVRFAPFSFSLLLVYFLCT